jgi:hypothetical protein
MLRVGYIYSRQQIQVTILKNYRSEVVENSLSIGTPLDHSELTAITQQSTNNKTPGFLEKSWHSILVESKCKQALVLSLGQQCGKQHQSPFLNCLTLL